MRENLMQFLCPYVAVRLAVPTRSTVAIKSLINVPVYIPCYLKLDSYHGTRKRSCQLSAFSSQLLCFCSSGLCCPLRILQFHLISQARHRRHS